MVEVNGREVNFKYSVGACIELARLCPEGDIANLMTYLNDSEAGRRAENRMRFVCILSLMGEKAAAFETPGYKPTPLTYDEVASLTLEEFAEIFNDRRIRQGHSQDGEGDPVKKNRGRGVKITPAFLVYFGLSLGMSGAETIHTAYGELLDLIDCRAIYNGADYERPLTYDEIMNQE